MEFKTVKGFPRYKCSKDGTVVINIKKNRVVSQQLKGYDSYFKIHLTKSKGVYKTLYVHRIIAHTWCELPKGVKFEDAIVNHKNHVKTDNHSQNLEFTCRSGNTKAHKEYIKNKEISPNKQILAGVFKLNDKK